MLQHRIRNQHNFSTGPSGGDLKSPQMQTGQRFRLACSTLSGESGIRTRGTLRYTSLAMMRIRPLCHLSGSYDQAAEYSRTTDERKSRH